MCNGRVVTSFVLFSDWQDNGECCHEGGEGGAGKVKLTTQVIFHAVQDNHGVLKAQEQQRRIFPEIKVKTTQRKVEIQFQKHSQLPETY